MTLLKKLCPKAQKRNVLDITLLNYESCMMEVSDTREAYGSGSPGHHAGRE